MLLWHWPWSHHRTSERIVLRVTSKFRSVNGLYFPVSAWRRMFVSSMRTKKVARCLSRPWFHWGLRTVWGDLGEYFIICALLYGFPIWWMVAGILLVCTDAACWWCLLDFPALSVWNEEELGLQLYCSWLLKKSVWRNHVLLLTAKEII